MYHDRAAWRCAFFCGQKTKWKQKISTKKMLPTYGEHCLSRQIVHNWVQKFSEGRTSIEDEHRAGRPVEIATPETLQRVEDIIRAKRRVTVDAVATAIGCSRGQAYNMMHEGLGCHKVSSRWVPRQLTPQHKSQRMGLSLQHLQSYQDDGDDMLYRIVTGDESWVHHYEPRDDDLRLYQSVVRILCLWDRASSL